MKVKKHFPRELSLIVMVFMLVVLLPLSGIAMAEAPEDVAAVTTRAELQDCIDNAEEGAVITVSQNIVFDDTPITVSVGKEITIRSAEGETVTLTQNTLAKRHFLVNGSLMLEDIVLDGGEAGGGVQVNSGGSFVMNDGSIIQNCSAVSGGGVYVDNGAFTMAGGEICNNMSSFMGGGIYVEGNGNAIIYGDSKIEGNEASYYGGGIAAAFGGDVEVFGDVVISGNKAASGGGISAGSQSFKFLGSSNTSITIDGNVDIIGNTATENGGGIYVHGIIVTVTFLGENLRYEYAVNVIMTSGNISDNTAASGGGVYVGSTTEKCIGAFAMDGGSICDNTAVDGGGIYTVEYDNLTTSGTVFSGNTASALYEPPEDAAETYSQIGFSGETSVPGFFEIDHPLNNYDINYADRNADAYYRISYNANGGNGSITEQFVKAGDTANINDGTTLARNGYSFNGWNTNPDGSGASYSSVIAPAVTENITIYAQWKLLSTDNSGGNYSDDEDSDTETSGTTEATADTANIEDEAIPLGSLGADSHIKYLNGYPDGSVRPDNALIRAEVASIFYNLLDESYKSGDVPSNFSDVSSDSWYGPAVNTLADMGYIEGYDDGTFRPNNTITRTEFVAIASRFVDLTSSEVTNTFSDVESNYWAVGYINTAYNSGWINGYEDGTFSPEKSISRAEAVKIVNTMFGWNSDSIEGEVNPYNDITISHWAYAYILEACV